MFYKARHEEYTVLANDSILNVKTLYNSVLGALISLSGVEIKFVSSL